MVKGAKAKGGGRMQSRSPRIKDPVRLYKTKKILLVYKWLGVIAMFGSLFILLILPLTDLSRIRGSQFRPAMKLFFWFFVVNFVILLWIGSQHPTSPYVEIGQISTAFYFLWFLVIVPVLGISENTIMDVATEK